MKLHVNGKEHEIVADADVPVRWALRDLIALTGQRLPS